MFQEAWQRFWRNFGGFYVVGLVSSLVWAVPFLALMGGMLLKMLPIFIDAAHGVQPDPNRMLSMMAGFFALIGLSWLIMILVMPFVLMAQLQAVHDVMLGQRPDLRRAMQGGIRLWARGLGYLLLMGICVQVALLPLMLVGVITLGIGMPVVFFGVIMLYVALFNGLYALVAENLSVTDAFTQAWQRLFSQFKEHAAAAGVVLLIQLVLMAAFFIMAVVPIIGWLAGAAFSFVLGPVLYLFVMHYLATRYHASMGPPEPPPYGG